MEDILEKLKYPIGRFSWQTDVNETEIRKAIVTISSFPSKIREAIQGFSATQLDTCYRPEGWTIRQVVHHCADSHLNAYVRFKLTLTEDTPVIKPYFEARWATLPDSYELHPEVSLNIIDGIHARWAVIMEHMSPGEWEKQFIHPEYNKTYALKQIVMMYAWHSEHHLAHITSHAERSGWAAP